MMLTRYGWRRRLGAVTCWGWVVVKVGLEFAADPDGCRAGVAPGACSADGNGDALVIEGSSITILRAVAGGSSKSAFSARLVNLAVNFVTASETASPRGDRTADSCPRRAAPIAPEKSSLVGL